MDAGSPVRLKAELTGTRSGLADFNEASPRAQSYMLDTYVAVRHGQGQAWGDDLFHARTKKLHL